MHFQYRLLLTGLIFTRIAALHQISDVITCRKKSCPPFNGSFVIDYYQVYPENADFDFDSCRLYIGCVWTATVCFYDPYINKIVDILEFPGISHTETYHVGGTKVNERTGLLSILANAWEPVVSGGANLTGDNFFMQWSPFAKEVLYKINLTDTTDGKYAGFATIAHDPDDNAYIVGALPSSILKVSKDGKIVTPWYLPQPRNISINSGLGGIAATGWTLLTSDASKIRILRFDMRKPLGEPIEVPHYPNANWTFTDSGYLPPRHKGTVYLVAEDLVGVIVLTSKDGLWNTAEFLGKVLSPVLNSFTTEPVQIGDSLYLVPTDVGNISHINTGPGTKDKFPFIDITAQVDALLGI